MVCTLICPRCKGLTFWLFHCINILQLRVSPGRFNAYHNMYKPEPIEQVDLETVLPSMVFAVLVLTRYRR